MGKNKKLMSNFDALTFYKFLGTGGKNGFSLVPDFNTYALVTCWRNKEQAELFINESRVMQLYKEKTKSIRLIKLDPFYSHGSWDGVNPFAIKNKKEIANEKRVAIITRAKINWSKLISFWNHVPQSSRAIKQASGVYYYKGIGELPFIQQATISLWKSVDDVLQFAYKSKIHSKIVKKTREKKWYSEELFSRFYVVEDNYI